ncbi:aldehyde dehydrogenase [Actinocorallia aurantiaca]|uniref:aldehyde dehydrogenase (NAD(+)) n=1 Tax=Actinocorallia aurantiaca TaxID=46204 RepID=A0ABN3UPX9_9ACTN
MQRTPRLFIDGQWVSRTDHLFDVICPSTEERIGQAADASEEDVDTAVRAARRAFEDGPWRRLSVGERAELIERAAELFGVRAEQTGWLVTAEMGVPISTSVMLARRAANTMIAWAELARSTPLTEFRTAGGPTAVVREPVGVCAAISPWNGPVGMAVGKIVPALLAGCSVVYKPAPETPFDIAFLVDALREAGLPAGVLNVVTGGAETGRLLIRHPGVDKVGFTGSTAVGREIGAACGSEFKRVQLELGGKSAAIVLEDAEPDQVRAGLAMGCFFNSGQVCAALSRVLAPRRIYDEVVSWMEQAAGGWVLGDPFDSATTLGPLVSERQRMRVENYIGLGVEAGARLVCGGGRPEQPGKGWFIEPTVFADADNTMRIAREEIFGPVAVVVPYDDPEDAVRIANDSEYGLHGAVFTSDPEKAISVARRIRTGTFSINNFVYNNRVPFGGVKSSGIGRDSGKEGYESFFELKTINLDAGTAPLFAP